MVYEFSDHLKISCHPHIWWISNSIFSYQLLAFQPSSLLPWEPMNQRTNRLSTCDRLTIHDSLSMIEVILSFMRQNGNASKCHLSIDLKVSSLNRYWQNICFGLCNIFRIIRCQYILKLWLIKLRRMDIFRP